MPKPYPTQARLKELFDCDPNTGEFTRLKTTNARAVAGSITKGSLNGKGYCQIQIDNEKYDAHRIVWIWFNGNIPLGLSVDHIDRVKTNNSIHNLRLVTHKENQYNKNVQSNNKLGVLGVSYNEKFGKYYARLYVSGKKHWLGYFDTIQEASNAYLEAKIKYHIIEKR